MDSRLTHPKISRRPLSLEALAKATMSRRITFDSYHGKAPDKTSEQMKEKPGAQKAIAEAAEREPIKTKIVRHPKGKWEIEVPELIIIDKQPEPSSWEKLKAFVVTALFC